LGEAAISIEEQNKKIAELQARNSERLIAFVGIDPRRGNALEIVERGIKEYGMKGIKLYPACGFYPNETALQGFFEKCAEWNVPILIHTGQASQPLQSKYCKPIDLDDVLVRFPKIRIIAAHLGGGWHDELFWMGATKSNLFVDISAWQQMCLQNFPAFCSHLRQAIDMFGLYRVLFGTDTPFYNSVCPNKRFVETLAALPSNAPPGITFRSSEIQALLGENAKTLLQLT
jgi:predicted TIM-barrel fold metal-dependent hydrolase